MTDLVCSDCSRAHEPGLTGIDGDGNATCLDCHGELVPADGGQA